MKILVTGTAGFVGAAVAEALLGRGDEVVGVDNMSDYYDVSLKQARLDRISVHAHYRHFGFDLADSERTMGLFETERPQRVIHLAAQAGVRYSIENPQVYGSANLSAFLNILEGARHHGVDHLTYASSSSVYGGNTKTPFSERDAVDHPVSLYAATKKANELMAHTYAHLYRLPTTGLRFFTVYGPWGRPDMSPFIFVKKILAGEGSMYSTMATTNEISPISMTSSKGCCERVISPLSRTRTTTPPRPTPRAAMRRGVCSTSAANGRSN